MGDDGRGDGRGERHCNWDAQHRYSLSTLGVFDLAGGMGRFKNLSVKRIADSKSQGKSFTTRNEPKLVVQELVRLVHFLDFKSKKCNKSMERMERDR